MYVVYPVRPAFNLVSLRETVTPCFDILGHLHFSLRRHRDQNLWLSDLSMTMVIPWKLCLEVMSEGSGVVHQMSGLIQSSEITGNHVKYVF